MRMRWAMAGVLCGFGLLAAALPGRAGELTGSVVDHSEDGSRGIPKVWVFASGEGRSRATGAKTGGDGAFRIEDVPAGAWSLAVLPQGNHPAAYRSGVRVTGDAATPAPPLETSRTYALDGDSWLQWRREFGQTFIARGGWLTTIRIKAFNPAALVRVTLHHGGPNGPQVGPARTTPRHFGGEGWGAVHWAAGEIPTDPGQRYFIRLVAADERPWAVAVHGQGDVYADGHAWFDAIAHPESDLGLIVVESPRDGLAPEHALDPGFRTAMGRAFGQTFVARSGQLCLAALPAESLDGSPLYLRFSLHRDGPLGEPVGPSKSVRVVDHYNVSWSEGEVPLIPGRRYYLHVESFGGTPFIAWTAGDTFPGGHAYVDGHGEPGLDLALHIYGSGAGAAAAALDAAAVAVPLANPSFEDGLDGWSLTRELGGVVTAESGVTPAEGERMFGWTSRGEGQDNRTQIYQRVRVEKGHWYRFTGRVYTNHRGGRSSDVKIRVIVQPDGLEDFADARGLTSSQWFATEGRWIDGGVTFQARADSVLVGFDLEQRWPLEENNLYVDGAALRRHEPGGDGL